MLSRPPLSLAICTSCWRSELEVARRASAASCRCPRPRPCRTGRPSTAGRCRRAARRYSWISGSTLGSMPSARVTRFLFCDVLRLLGGDQAAVDLLLQQRMVARHLLELPAAQAVEARVADVRDRARGCRRRARPRAWCPCPRTAAGSARPGRSTLFARGDLLAQQPRGDGLLGARVDLVRLRALEHLAHLASMITLVAMPLATSPALYPPMPSASTTSPWAASVAIESSLCARTIPGSVQLAISSTCARSMRLQHDFHFGSPGASLDGSH